MSPNKKFASSEHRPILVANAKEVARWAAGARRQSGGPVPTMNDVLLAALGGGIRRYLELHHDPTVANSGKINMRAISIVNMRAVSGLAKDSKALLNDVKAARWGNDFSYFIIPLPCNHMRPADRIGFMSSTMSFIKRSPEALFIREGTKTLFVVRCLCLSVRVLEAHCLTVSQIQHTRREGCHVLQPAQSQQTRVRFISQVQ